MTNTHRIIAQITTTKKDEFGWPWERTSQVPSFNIEASDFDQAVKIAGTILGCDRASGPMSVEVTVLDLSMSTMRDFKIENGEISSPKV